MIGHDAGTAPTVPPGTEQWHNGFRFKAEFVSPAISTNGIMWRMYNKDGSAGGMVVFPAGVYDNSLTDHETYVYGASEILRGRVRASAIRGTTIKDSSITDSNVMGSNVTGASKVRRATVESSILEGANVRDSIVRHDVLVKNSDIFDSNVARSYVTGGSSVLRSTIEGSMLDRAHVRDSTIRNVALQNVSLANANIASLHHIIRVDNVCSEYLTALLYRTHTEQGYRFDLGCWEGTLEQFSDMIEGEDWPSADELARKAHRPELLALHDMFTARVETWRRTDFGRNSLVYGQCACGEDRPHHHLPEDGTDMRLCDSKPGRQALCCELGPCMSKKSRADL